MQRQAMLCVPELRLHPSRCRTQRRNRLAPGMNDRGRTRRRHEVHGKTQRFALQLPPQHSPHAKVMQPLQCVLQHDVANPHLSTHMATKRDNNHAAITLQSASTDSKTPYNYTTRCTTFNWPWYNLHSEISKKCLALWRRIDFDILGVKIRGFGISQNYFFFAHHERV